MVPLLLVIFETFTEWDYIFHPSWLYLTIRFQQFSQWSPTFSTGERAVEVHSWESNFQTYKSTFVISKQKSRPIEQLNATGNFSQQHLYKCFHCAYILIQERDLSVPGIVSNTLKHRSIITCYSNFHRSVHRLFVQVYTSAGISICNELVCGILKKANMYKNVYEWELWNWKSISLGDWVCRCTVSK